VKVVLGVRGVAELKWDVCSHPAVSVGSQRKQVRRASRRADGAAATSNVPVTVTVPGECSKAQAGGSCGKRRGPGAEQLQQTALYSQRSSPSAAPSHVAIDRTPQNHKLPFTRLLHVPKGLAPRRRRCDRRRLEHVYM
jgi:hypothetical protein